jgi:phosphoserine phosphatase
MATEFTLVSLHPIPNFLQSLANFDNREEFAIGHLQSLNSERLLRKIRESLLDAEAAGVKPRLFRPKALFFDMDSTVIGQETIVELSRAAGRSQEVEAITTQAMEGKLDFVESLRLRVQTLAGLPASILAETQPRLIVEPGMRELIKTASANKVPSFLISGGFRDTAKPIVDDVGFADYHANSLEIIDSRLTGRLLGEIVDGRRKASWLVETCKKLGIAPAHAVAIGDGANDLAMMKEAGLAVGYNPKSILLPHLHAVNRSGSHRFLEYYLF